MEIPSSSSISLPGRSDPSNFREDGFAIRPVRFKHDSSWSNHVHRIHAFGGWSIAYCISPRSNKVALTLSGIPHSSCGIFICTKLLASYNVVMRLLVIALTLIIPTASLASQLQGGENSTAPTQSLQTLQPAGPSLQAPEQALQQQSQADSLSKPIIDEWIQLDSEDEAPRPLWPYFIAVSLLIPTWLYWKRFGLLASWQ